ncbi:hypothetical protein LR48_Vigan05g127200 [Vigna angularis]|uniref:Uncharacterized protein n=1 Tax=Phaseolus angularis TaxID=3914 RepID=A0A0L9UM74_PHAAN|nr:hypothetical protein LR48_Vigan05g127200 [Vigna angularis]
MQPELDLHVPENERLKTRKLTSSELKIVRFKMKLRTPEMLLRCLNGDRRRAKLDTWRPFRGVFRCVFNGSDNLRPQHETLALITLRRQIWGDWTSILTSVGGSEVY